MYASKMLIVNVYFGCKNVKKDSKCNEPVENEQNRYVNHDSFWIIRLAESFRAVSA